MYRWLKENDIHRHSTYNEGKAVVVERFNRTLKKKTWKYFSANNTYRYVDVLDTLLKQYNTSHHRSMRMTPTKARKTKSSFGIICMVTQSNPTNPNSKSVIAFEYPRKRPPLKRIHTQLDRRSFQIVEIQNTNRVTYKVKDLNGESVDRSFYEPELQKTTQDVFRIEKLIRRKGQRAFVKWKGYHNTFNSWVDNLTTLG